MGLVIVLVILAILALLAAPRFSITNAILKLRSWKVSRQQCSQGSKWSMRVYLLKV
nr:hypothetical protein [Vibrio taketomensis]